MSTFHFVPDNDIKSMALSLYNGQPLLSTWYKPTAWYLSSGGTLVPTTVSGASGVGFCGSVATASGVYMMQHTGSLIHLNNVGNYAAISVSSGIYRGISAVSGNPYVVDASGNISVLVSGAINAVSPAPAFGSTPPAFLVGSGSTLYTLLPYASGVGTFTLSGATSGASGLITTPFSGLSCLAVSGSNIAVGGYNLVAFGSGYNGLCVSPGTYLAMAGTRSSSGAVDLYANKGSGVWTLTQTVTGLGNPANVGWAPSDGFLFLCDPTNNHLLVFTYISGVIALSQTLSATDATNVAITSDSLNGLVCSPSSNEVIPITFNGSWSTLTGVTLSGAQSVITSGPLNAYVGYASGVASLTLLSTWGVSASATLPFTPTAMVLGDYNQLYVTGTNAGSGYLYGLNATTLTTTTSASWGSPGTNIWYQSGQILVMDSASSNVRVYGIVNLQVQFESSFAAPSNHDAIAGSPSDLFIAGSSATWQYFYGGPYSVLRRQTGEVGIYQNPTWYTASLGASGLPTAVTFDVSGNVTVATQQNTLITVSATGIVTSSGTIAQTTGQAQGVPIGISSLLWSGASLYAATSLNDALVQIQ